MVTAAVEEPNVIVMFEEAAKFEPETVTVTPTIPDDRFSVIEGTLTVSEADPVRDPVPTSPVTVIEKVPPGVEPDVVMVSGVIVAVTELDGNATGLARVIVLLTGTPVSDSRIVPGRDTVVDPETRETLTV